MSRNLKRTEALVAAAAAHARRLLALAAARLDPWAGRLAGLVLGLVGGWYGAAAGFLLGFMVDSLRSGRRLRRYWRDPDSPRPPEGLPGLAALAALASSPSWPGPAVPAERRAVLLEATRKKALCGAGFAPAPGEVLGLERQLSRLSEAAAAEESLPYESLARDLALRGGPEAQAILAAFAYGLAAAQAGAPGPEAAVLDHEAEAVIVEALVNAGCPAELIAQERSLAFPGYRDPWELLGISRDTELEDVKRAWRRKSRRSHPDVAGEAGADEFRALKSAYEYLKSRRPS